MTDPTARFADVDDLVDELERQKVIQGDPDVARALAEAGELVAFAPGAELMRQGDRDDDCFFILAGTVQLWVKGELLPYGRGPGDLVGEFSAINRAIPRTATVVAADEVVALRCSAATFKTVGRQQERLWRLLAVELAAKVYQRNTLISAVNERPRILMIAAAERMGIAQALRTTLSRDYDVDLWSDDDLAPPVDYELEALRARAREADFGVVLADERDLADSTVSGEAFATVKFELGYVMSELTPHRTLLLVPCGAEPPRLFKGLQPMTYELPTCNMPLQVALARAVDEIRGIIDDRKVRSRLRKAD